jgi:toxin ParE1/3/4
MPKRGNIQVVWTKSALESLHAIFNYYKTNVSVRIAESIKSNIFKASKQLKLHPGSGTKEYLLESLNEDHRYIIVLNYKLIYKLKDDVVYITDVFDMRQNPDKIVIHNSEDLNEPDAVYGKQHY